MTHIIQAIDDRFLNYFVLAFFVGVALFIMYYVFKHHGGMIEGLANRNKKDELDTSDNDIVAVAKRQKETTEKINESLNMDQHYNNYNEIITHTHDWINAKIVGSLKGLTQKIQTGDADMDDIVKHMNDLNTMKKFRGTLEECTAYIDSH